MDKNKSRTDLLAAGRKKLQQFRQKKEGKGSSSHGKSSKRSGKSEEHDGDGDPDGDAASAVSKPKPIESLHIHEEVTGTQHPDSSVSDVDSSMSQSMEDSLAPDINSPSVNPLLVPGPLETLREEMGVAFNSGLPVEGSEIDEAGLISTNSKERDSHSLVSNEGESPKIIEAEMGIVASLENSEVAVHEGEFMHATSSVPVDLPAPLSVPDDAMKSVLVSVDTESAHREDERKFLPSEQDIPDMFLIQAREDQVTDEADSSGSKQLDSLEEDQRLDLSKFVEGTETQSGEVSGEPIMESTGEAEQSGSLAVACNVPEEFSVTTPGTDGASAVTPEMTDQWRENLVKNSDNEEKLGLISAPGDFTSYTEVAIQVGVTKQAEHEGFVQDYLNEGSYVSKDESFSRPLGTKSVSLSGGLTAPPGESVSSISLLQFAEALKGLDEDEFRFLLKSRDSALNARIGDTGTLHAPEYDLSEVLETFKEQFYLANIMKDIFTDHSKLQMEIQMISDHQRQDLEDKISTLSVSLSEVSEINKSLTEEIAQSRSELLAVTNAREELKDQLQAVRADVAESSGRVYELQNELERSRGDLSSLSLELANCKSLVEALQLENSNLSSSLTSAIEARKKLEEEKEYSILDNDKLSLELTKCKDLVAALQMENAELSGTVDFVTEERKKLEDEKEYVVHENDKLLSQVADSKALVVAIQVEHANVNGALALVTEEMKKLEEEKQSSLHEIDRLNSKLTECRSLVEVMQVENANLSEGLSSMTEERRKLEVEKDYLIGENKVLLSELCVNQDRISVSQAENLQLEADSREVNLCLEQLIQDNIFLDSSLDIHKAKIKEINNSSLDIHKAKIKEINNMQVPLASHSIEAWVQIESPDLPSRAHENAIINEGSHQLSGKQDDEISSPMLEGTPLADDYVGGAAPKQLGQDAYSDSFGFVDLNRRLEAAEKIMLKLEKAIEEMHSHSASLSRAGGKAASSGVSKLIQAFESKTHLDDDEVETTLSTEDRSVADPFLLSKEQTANLRAALKKLGLEAAHASELFKGERNGREFANVAYREIKVQYEAMKEHADILEAMNIEFEVQCEIFKQHICRVEDKKSELVVLYESLQQQNISREAENTELSKKLNYCQSRISELHGQLRELEQSSEEITSSISNQIEKLQNEAAEKLEAAGTDYEAICSSYNEVNNKLKDLQVTNELAVDVLHKIYCNLRELVSDSSAYMEDSEVNLQNEESLYSLDLSKYEALMDQLGTFLDERLQLKSENNKLNIELVSRTEDVEELNRKCLDWNVVLKLVEDVDAVVKAEDVKIDVDKLPLSRLESFVSFLLQRYVEADEQVNFAREELRSKVMEFSEFQEKINQLGSLNLLQENEIVSLKESLSKAEESIVTVRSELQEKIIGLEQSEQRVSSIREKLSIAVAKGKGLIAQRDHLKQILAEKSIELERCSQELQLKDARVDEVETKLKTYSEAGERVEALESELSYIRNSATALRESFLLKDSVLQRIEEILEDLDLSENFHSRDIIEKVDWLARSVTGNSLPPVDWDHKSSVEKGAYSDAGFAVMDGWKEDIQPSSNPGPGDDLRRKYDELQSKFYGLAEQNEMLEQSLMERNNLVQRWEEVLDRINVPSQLRSMEPEDRIEWLGSALSEAHHHADSLQQKIGDTENYCGTLTTDLEESKRRLLDVVAAFQVVVQEKEHLSKSLETLTCDHEKLSDRAVQFELENDKLQNELTGLQEKLVEKHKNEEQGDRIEGEIRRLQDLVSKALQDPGTEELDSSGSSIECLGGLVRKLVDNYTSLYSGTPMLRAAVDAPITGKLDGTVDEARDRDTLDTEEPDVVILKKELDEAFSDLRHMKEERDCYMERQQSLFVEVEALNKKTEEFQELLSQEEKKSASVREKLNVAVRKGKLLVQQRDSLKQTIEELNNEVESLKSKNNQLENIVTQYEQKIKDLSPYPERVSSLESETLSLRNHLIETEHSLQEKGHTLKMILNTLGEIDVGSESSLSDPVGRLQQLGKLCFDLHSAVASSEHESRKSKRAAELLLAELNEVQERNDSLQEELAKAGSELIDLSKERDMAEAAKLEALSHLESLSSVHSEARKDEDAEFMALKSVVHQLRGNFFDINDLLSDVLSKDLEFFHNLNANLESCLKSSSDTSVVGMPLVRAHDGVSSYLENKEKFFAKDCVSDIKMQEHFNDSLVAEVCRDVGHDLEGLTTEMGALKEKLQKHSISLDVEAGELFKIMEIVLKESASQTESSDSLKREIMHIESVEKEKGMENAVLRKNIALLYEACASSIMEIENRKAQIPENNMPAGDLGLKLQSAVAADGGRLFSEVSLLSSEEQIRTMADGLLMVVKNLTNWEGEIVEGREKEMKTAIANLQKELQEKDIQRERICMELVSQIQEAEAAATSYSMDFQSAKTRLLDLVKHMEVMEEERKSLGQRVKELQAWEATSVDLQERIRSMTEILAAKDQEIESLMQALDEEETQMEELTNKIAELEQVMHQKNIDFDNLEASRGKAMKKLSITVNKFDELHNLSANLLAEVEKLQSQLQDRDAEISFLRQEVTRCTNDVLVASQMSNKGKSDEILELLIWLDTVISQVQMHDMHLDYIKGSQVNEYKELLQKQITSIISELEDLRVTAQSKDALIQVERSRVEELTRKGEVLENSLRQKEMQFNLHKNVRDSGEATEIMEVEPAINNRTIPGTSVSTKVRSLRKANNDQVAISIDMDPTSNSRLEDDDDDKVHGFKSLTTSRIVPRFTRPVTDMIDGLWVSCDRALMRQPALRLGIIIYWAVLHAVFATFVV